MSSNLSSNNLSECDEDVDQMFIPPTFLLSQDNVEDDEDMPSNLMNSRCNIPGMSPQELMHAHRRSLVAMAKMNKQSPTDIYSITLSRLQVEREDVRPMALSDIATVEYRRNLKDYRFGESSLTQSDEIFAGSKEDNLACIKNAS